jgi:signal transduction histidine kinase/ActR/RegA family two-component response regulator
MVGGKSGGAVEPPDVLIEARLADRTLRGLFAISMPLLVLSLVRVVEVGWLPTMTLHITLVVLLGASVALRERLAVGVKGGLLVALFLAIGLGAAFTNGVFIWGAPYFVIALLLTSVFFRLRVTIAATVAILSFGALHEWWTHGHLGLHTLLSLVALSALPLLVVYALGSLKTALASAVTTLRGQNERLLEAHEELLAANHAKSDFLANMSHELRTPMTGILGSADLLRQRPLAAEDLEYVELIRSSGDALLALLNDILDLSKIEAKRLRLEAAPLSLHAIVGDVATMMRAGAEAKGLALETAIPEVLPDVLGDPLRLRQVLLNLVGNAVKFTERGKIVIVAEIIERDADELTVHLAVRDSGIGVRPEDLPHLFRSFHQVETSSDRRYGGTGLGLAISKHLVHLMGGELGVDSEFGVGSEFWLTLPMRRASTPAARPRVATAPAPREPLDTSGRLLVADDSDVNRIVIEAFLERLGFTEIDVASGGREALDRLAEAAYDVALVDISMSDLGGVELLRRLRRGRGRNAQVPVIALTATASIAEASLRAAGVSSLLHKPIDLDRLTAALRPHLPAASRRAG